MSERFPDEAGLYRSGAERTRKPKEEWKPAAEECLATILNRIAVVVSDCTDMKTLTMAAETVSAIVGYGIEKTQEEGE